MKLILSYIKLNGSVLKFDPPLNVHRNIYINSKGPSFTLHVDEFCMTVVSYGSFEEASDRLIKELFKLWEVATRSASTLSPRVTKIRDLGTEMPTDFINDCE